LNIKWGKTLNRGTLNKQSTVYIFSINECLNFVQNVIFWTKRDHNELSSEYHMTDKAPKPSNISLWEPSKTDMHNTTFYCIKCKSMAFRSTEPWCFHCSDG
jgi:hypothetical protein